MSQLKQLFYSVKFRSIAIQLITLLVAGGVMLIFIYNASTNLSRQGIASGFGFLSETSGFAINQLPISYSESSSYFRAFLVGLINTIIVSVLGIITATFIGFWVAIFRLSSNYLLKKLAEIYVELLRNIPLLLLIFFCYFVVLGALPHARNSLDFFDIFFLNNRGFYFPALVHKTNSIYVSLFAVGLFVGLCFIKRYLFKIHMQTGKRHSLMPYVFCAFILLAIFVLVMSVPYEIEYPEFAGFNFEGGIVLSPEFLALYVGLSIYTGAFIAECVRAGILSVPRGQVEAARSLGLSYAITTKKVIIPQAMRVIIPPLTSQYLNLTKNSSLAAAIGYPELVSVFAGTVLNQTGQAVEVLAITMSVYLILSLSMSLMMNIYNKKTLLKER